MSTELQPQSGVGILFSKMCFAHIAFFVNQTIIIVHAAALDSAHDLDVVFQPEASCRAVQSSAQHPTPSSPAMRSEALCV